MFLTRSFRFYYVSPRHIKELCKIRDKVEYNELNPLKANTLIELICTN